MKKIFISFLIAHFSFLIVQMGQAQVIRHVPGDYATIQAAVDAAGFGDTILVEQGRYFENVIVQGNNKAILLASNFIFTGDSADIINTIIDASQPTNPNNGMGILLKNIDTTLMPKVTGFTITGGTGYYHTYGGGIHSTGAIAVIEHNIVENCSIAGVQSNGGGIRMAQGITDTSKVGIIRYNIIRNCTINSVSNTIVMSGGGLSIGPIRVVVEGNQIHDNYLFGSPTSDAWGAGIYYEYYNNPVFGRPVVQIRNNHIYHNHAEGLKAAGGAIFFSDNVGNVFLTIENNILSENSASSLTAGGEAYGGALILEIPKSGSVISGNIISDNAVEVTSPGVIGYGGGIYFNYIISPDPDYFIALEENRLTGNSAQGGGGIYNQFSGLRIRNNFISGNQAVLHGGGLAMAGNNTEVSSLINNTITENAVTGPAGKGGGMYISNYEGLLLMNNIFFNNQAPDAGELQIYSSAVEIHNCDIDEGEIVGSSWTGADNIFADPEFIDGMIWDCADPGPCWDAGRDTLTAFGILFSAPDSCIGHNQRPLDQAVDIGACEVEFCSGIFHEEDARIPMVVNPNPFCDRVTVIYTLAKESGINISLFDSFGRLIRVICREKQFRGSYALEFNAYDLPSGVYLLRISTIDNRQSTVKMVKL